VLGGIRGKRENDTDQVLVAAYASEYSVVQDDPQFLLDRNGDREKVQRVCSKVFGERELRRELFPVDAELLGDHAANTPLKLRGRHIRELTDRRG